MVEPHEILLKLFLGGLLGGIIGFERQTHGRAAGFRTQLLVCVACVLLMIISEGYYFGRPVEGSGSLRIDPTRIAAGAMTGVGFLGAGVILKTGVSIQGLTTAACIWMVSAIGLAVGAGQYVAAISGFAITVFALWVLRYVELIMPRTSYRYVTLVTDDSSDEEGIKTFFTCRGCSITKMDYEMDIAAKEKTFVFTIASKDSVSMDAVIRDITATPSAKRLSIKS